MNNVAEIRIDAQKYLLHSRRPVPKRVPGIGAWNGILLAATHLGVITNVKNLSKIALIKPFQTLKLYRLL